MQVGSVSHVYGWYSNKRVVTEYSVTPHKGGNTVYNSQRWFYPVHIYDNTAKIIESHRLGNTVDIKV